MRDGPPEALGALLLIRGRGKIKGNRYSWFGSVQLLKGIDILGLV